MKVKYLGKNNFKKVVRDIMLLFTLCQRLKSFGISVLLFCIQFSIVFFSNTQKLNAQTLDSTYQLIQTIETDATFFTTDNLQQLYLVNSENEIVKFTAEGKDVFRFSNNTLGDLTFLDAGNPFNLLLYYPEYQNIITLDRTLNQRGQFNLYDLGFLQVQAVGMSKDNRIWLFDNLNCQLKKIDNDGTIVIESDDLRLLLGQSVQANFLLEREQQIFVNDPKLGILIFDDFGQYIKTIDFKGLRRFQVIGNRILFVEDGKLKAFNLHSLLMETIKVPNKAGDLENIQIQKNRLYNLEKGALMVFTF